MNQVLVFLILKLYCIFFFFFFFFAQRWLFKVVSASRPELLSHVQCFFFFNIKSLVFSREGLCPHLSGLFLWPVFEVGPCLTLGPRPHHGHRLFEDGRRLSDG